MVVCALHYFRAALRLGGVASTEDRSYGGGKIQRIRVGLALASFSMVCAGRLRVHVAAVGDKSYPSERRRHSAALDIAVSGLPTHVRHHFWNDAILSPRHVDALVGIRTGRPRIRDL